MTEKNTWVLACNAIDIEDDDVVRFDHESKSFAIYNLGGDFYATDGYCTHEQQHLCEGFVEDGIIECPLHMGQFDIETGDALSGPVCIDLAIYETRNANGKIYLNPNPVSTTEK